MTAQARSQPQIQPREYAQFIDQIELVNVTLLSSGVKNRGFEETSASNKLAIRSKSRYENRPGLFHAFQDYRAVVSDSSTKRQTARLSVEFAVTYRSKRPMTDDIFSVFKDLNLVANTWPYLREFMHTNIGKMNLPPLVLPTFKIGTWQAGGRIRAGQTSVGRGPGESQKKVSESLESSASSGEAENRPVIS